MKNIDKIKKAELPYYSYNGNLVILLDEADIIEGTVSYIAAYEIEDLDEQDIQKILNKEIHVKGIETDGYDWGIEIVEQDIINYENPQKVIRQWIAKDESLYEEAKKELTCTSRYHNWSRTVADELCNTLEKVQEDEDVNTIADLDEWDTQIVTTYNKHVSEFNKYGDADPIEGEMEIGDALATIEETQKSLK